MRAVRHRGLMLAMAAALVLPGWAQSARAHPARASATNSRAGSSARPVSVAAGGELIGMVTDAAGKPQADALVQVRADGVHGELIQARTNQTGLFRLADLAPGVYYVEVGKGSRVAERRRVEIHASERALLLVDLPKVLESAHFGPPPAGQADQSFDWALRQDTVWKPVLRLADANAPAAPGAAAPDANGDFQGYVALTAGAGSGAFQTPDIGTEFRVNSSMGRSARVSLSGDVGTNGQGGGSDTRLVATIRPADPSSSMRVRAAVRQLSLSGLPQLASLRVLSLDYANGVSLSDRLRLQYGAMMNAVTLSDTVGSFNPYFRVIYRVGQQGELEYRAISAVPPVHFARDFAEMPDPTPQVTLEHNQARLESAHHQEIVYTDSLTPNDTVSAAVFDEHFGRAAVNGTFSLDGGNLGGGMSGAEMIRDNLLPDLLNNMFIANGGGYGGWGYRVALRHRLDGSWRAVIGYSDSAVLVPSGASFTDGMAAALSPGRASALSFKLSGITPLTHTRLVCSYRAQDRPTATGVDLYNDGMAQTQPYANIYLRQPLPSVLGAGGGRIAALLEINNLLAQGYIPVVGMDGRMLYLVQSARSFRGGLTISF